MSELMELVDRLTVETRQILHTDAGPAVVRAAPLLMGSRARANSLRSMSASGGISASGIAA